MARNRNNDPLSPALSPKGEREKQPDLLSSSRPTAAVAGATTANGVASKLPGADAPPAPALAMPAGSRQDAGAPSVCAPSVCEYTPLASSEQWRVEKFELLAAEFNLTGPGWEEQMVHLHEIGLSHTRQWLMARKLFGIGPMIIPEGADPTDFEARSRFQVCEALGIEADQLQAELDALRTVWRNYFVQEVAPQQAAEAEAAADVSGDVEPELKYGEEILAKHGFEESMFDAMVWDAAKKEETPRSQDKNRLERNWFTQRVEQWDKMLSEAMSSAIAREALMNELYLRRFSAEMAVLSPSSSRFRDLQGLKKETERALQQQTEKLEEMFPDMATAGKVSFRQCISDLNQGYRDYYGRGDRKLVNKINTATEMEILTRTSAQMPEPRIRFGLNVAIVEAIHGLYDPNFRTQFKPAVLKKLDAAARAAVNASREAQNEPVVDLEDGVMPGEGSQFEDLLSEG